MADYALITPRPGAEHRPNTPGGAWKYPFDGQWKSIKDKDGKPRPIPVEEAQHALNYFTPHGSLAEESLVEMELREGELEVRLAGQESFTDPDTGEEFGSLAELLTSAKARAVAEATAPKPAAAAAATAAAPRPAVAPTPAPAPRTAPPPRPGPARKEG